MNAIAFTLGSPRARGRRDVGPHSRDSLSPEFCQSFAPSSNRGRTRPSKRGRGEDRVRAAPAVSCAMCIKRNAHEHTGSAETLRPSPRNGSTAYIALSLVNRSLLTPSPADHSADLTPAFRASGPRDLAVRSRPSPPRRRRARAPFVHAPERMTAPPRPPHPAPRFATVMKRPSLGHGMAGIIQVIWGGVKNNSVNRKPPTGAVGSVVPCYLSCKLVT
jgi:hypothetical protein